MAPTQTEMSKWPKSKMAYGDVKNVLIDIFLQILAVLVIRMCKNQFFYEI